MVLTQEKIFPLKKEKEAIFFSESGEKYLDFVQGIAVNVLGHCHEHLVKTIQEQSKKLWHVSNAFCNSRTRKISQKTDRKNFC